MQRFGSKRSLLLAVAARGSAGAALEEHATAGRPPLAALVNGLVARATGAGTPEALANHLAFLQMDLADPEFHALALDDAMRVRERIEALLRRALAGGRARGRRSRGARRARCRSPSTAPSCRGPSSATAR